VSLRKTPCPRLRVAEVEDPRKRKHLADLVAKGELSLVKLREKIDATPRARVAKAAKATRILQPLSRTKKRSSRARCDLAHHWHAQAADDDSLITVRAQLNDAMTDLITVLQSDVIKDIDEVDRQNWPSTS